MGRPRRSRCIEGGEQVGRRGLYQSREVFTAFGLICKFRCAAPPSLRLGHVLSVARAGDLRIRVVPWSEFFVGRLPLVWQQLHHAPITGHEVRGRPGMPTARQANSGHRPRQQRLWALKSKPMLPPLSLTLARDVCIEHFPLLSRLHSLRLRSSGV